MIEQIGFQAIAEQFGLVYALIPVCLAAIAIGWFGVRANSRSYSRLNIEPRRRRVNLITMSVIFFMIGWYVFNFQAHWIIIAALFIFAIAIEFVFTSHEAIIGLDYKSRIEMDIGGSLTYAFLVFFVPAMLFGVQNYTGFLEESLDKEKQRTYYIQDNDLAAFTTVEHAVDIDPLYRMKLYLNNLDVDSIQDEAILLSREIQRSGRYNPKVESIVYGVELFIREHYADGESVLRTAGHTTLADFCKALNFYPLILKLDVGDYTVNRDLIPRTKELFIEKASIALSQEAPALPHTEYISVFKWNQWYNLMYACGVFAVFSLLFSGLSIHRLKRTAETDEP